VKSGKLQIGNSIIKVFMPKSQNEMATGLKNFTVLPADTGMWFNFTRIPGIPSMTTVGMKFPIDIIGINADQRVISINTYEPELNTIAMAKHVKHVLEVAENVAEKIGVRIGQQLQFADNSAKPVFTRRFKQGGIVNAEEVRKAYQIHITDIKPQDNHLQVLGAGGEVIMNIKGGDRIFSRPHTLQLIAAAKTKSPAELAKLMLEIIEIQDNTPPEYAD
jgi:uncharacterized membrane protein (UPF0127 family)